MADLRPYSLHTFLALAEDAASAGRMRDALLAAGIDGWTERPTVGYWRGERIDGQTEFEIAAPESARDAVADALVAAHSGQPDGVFQLTHIDPRGSRVLYEARAERIAA